MSDLADELTALPPDLRAVWDERGLGDAWLCAEAETLDRDPRIELAGRTIGTLPVPPSPTDRHHGVGEELLANGRVALCVLAGGMATRMGGVVKALVEALPGLTFLDARLAEQRAQARTFGKAPPLWLMTSEATHAPIVEHLDKSKPAAVRVFRQNVSLRLTPDGKLFRTADGRPSLHATGHGDVVPGLQTSGLLADFVAQGGRYVWIANLDNLGATIDPSLLGLFAQSDAPLAVEVCEKAPGDRGGVPVRLGGRVEVLEEFRLPAGFDPESVRIFNTNTMIVDARRLLELSMRWTWFVVKKSVDGRTALQLERLLGELTAALDSIYFRVERDGERSRFLPVKDHDELLARRPLLEKILRSRGILSA